MTHSYNSLQLIKFIYGECFVTEIFEVEHALENDSVLKAEYDGLIDAKSILPKVAFAPNLTTIQNILNYSIGNMQMT